MNLFARQGDLVIERLARAIPGELTAVKNFTLAGDSSGHPHTLFGAASIRRIGTAVYLECSATLSLEHGKTDGHPTVALPAGNYEIRPLREDRDGTDQSVID